MPVDISLTQGEEIHREAVAFLLPFPPFFCSELGRESGRQCGVHGAPSRLALIQQAGEDAQHTLWVCCDTGADDVGLMSALPVMQTPQTARRSPANLALAV